MLEIDIDIGRLAPLGRNEALEQKLRSDGIDRRDAEHVANRAVRRRPSPLTNDLTPPRLGDDRMNRQKIRCVFQICDQLQFVLELGADLAFDPFRIALGRLFPGEPFQLYLRRSTRNADLVRVLVAQLLKAERAAFCYLQRARDRGGVLEVTAEESLHFLARLQVAVCKSLPPIAKLVDRASLPDAGHDILQHPPIWRMVENIIGGDGRHVRGGRHVREIAQSDRVLRPAANG